MQRVVLLLVMFLFGASVAKSSPYQAQLSFGYRPQVTTSFIDYPFLSSWDGFVDVPLLGLRFSKSIYDEWYLTGNYRYFFKTSGLDAGNDVSLNYYLFTVGPYYRSPTTDGESFFINLYGGIGFSYAEFSIDIGNAVDSFSRYEPALVGIIGFEKMIIKNFSATAEVTYNALYSVVKGELGQSATPFETTVNVNGLDISLGIAYQFEM